MQVALVTCRGTVRVWRRHLLWMDEQMKNGETTELKKKKHEGGKTKKLPKMLLYIAVYYVYVGRGKQNGQTDKVYYSKKKKIKSNQTVAVHSQTYMTKCIIHSTCLSVRHIIIHMHNYYNIIISRPLACLTWREHPSRTNQLVKIGKK